jgi:hypothetical protein
MESYCDNASTDITDVLESEEVTKEDACKKLPQCHWKRSGKCKARNSHALHFTKKFDCDVYWYKTIKYKYDLLLERKLESGISTNWAQLVSPLISSEMEPGDEPDASTTEETSAKEVVSSMKEFATFIMNR